MALIRPTDLDSGTREGRRSILWLTRRAVREGRAALAAGDHLGAIDAFLAADYFRGSLARYYALRLAVVNDPLHNVARTY